MKIGIAGVGNLGRSLLEGVMRSDTPSSDIIVCEQPEYVSAVCEKYGVTAADDLNALIKACDVTFITLKGYVFAEQVIDRPIAEGKTIVSFMAGVPFEKLHEVLGECRIVRAMPSLAISVCDGVIGYTAAPDDVRSLLDGLGYAFECAPDEIEKVMAFSSCGLGFAAYLIDAFAKAGIELGFSGRDAMEIASRTFKNAVDRGDYAATVSSVATKGGATEQGVLHMTEAHTGDIIARAVQKAYDKMK